MEKKTKITLISGIYNCADTLPQAIESILAQTYVDWEWVLCDDCSTDNTYEVAREYADKYPDRIILLRNEKNMRLAYSLNRCLQIASGYYIARMDGDDLSAPDRFEKQIEFLQKHQDIQVVGTAMQQFNDVDGNIRLITKPEYVKDKYIMHKCIPFNHATIMTYKSVYDVLGGYTVADRTKRGQDYDLWFRFLYSGFTGANINEPLYFVREDINAIKRRTFKVRWANWETTKFGYKLLGYPKSWLYEEFCINLAKSLTPHNIQLLYRKYQKKRSKDSVYKESNT